LQLISINYSTILEIPLHNNVTGLGIREYFIAQTKMKQYHAIKSMHPDVQTIPKQLHRTPDSFI
jgi:hypothetical protein